VQQVVSVHPGECSCRAKVPRTLSIRWAALQSGNSVLERQVHDSTCPDGRGRMQSLPGSVDVTRGSKKGTVHEDAMIDSTVKKCTSHVCDAVRAVGTTPCDIARLPIDTCSASTNLGLILPSGRTD